MAELRDIPIELVDEPELPSRFVFDEQGLLELAESIKLHGLIQPIVVVEENGRYRTCAGHRRLLAARLAYAETVSCLVHTAGSVDAEAVTLEENLGREDVTAAEQGAWILTLAEKKGWTMDQLCRKFKKSEAWINERAELVQKDPTVAAAVARREIPFSVAKELLRCKDEPHRAYLLGEAVTHGYHAASIRCMVDAFARSVQAGITPLVQLTGSSPAAPAPEALSPHCVFCGSRDAAQNLIQIMVHFYHWTPIKKLLRDTGVEVYEQPRE